VGYKFPIDSFKESALKEDQIIFKYEDIYGMYYIVEIEVTRKKYFYVVFVEGCKFNKEGHDDGCWWRKQVTRGPFDFIQLLNEIKPEHY
jgi:hypothetical protein